MSEKWSGCPWLITMPRHLVDPDPLLEPRERSGARVEPEVRALVAEQVAARRPAGSRPGPAGPEDGQFHEPPPTGWAWAARTSRSSGPRKTSARRWNSSGSPGRQELVHGSGRLVAFQPGLAAAWRTRPWRSPRPRTPARRPGRAPAGAGPTAAGSACSPGSTCRCPSRSAAQDTRARPFAAHRSWCRPARRAPRTTGQAWECSVTRAPVAATARSYAPLVDRGLGADQADHAVARGADRGAGAGVDHAHHRDARAHGDVADARQTSTELHATTSIFTSRCTR